MKLHPDKHDGCEVKSGEFKQVTEAYQILSGEFPLSDKQAMIIKHIPNETNISR